MKLPRISRLIRSCGCTDRSASVGGLQTTLGFTRFRRMYTNGVRIGLTRVTISAPLRTIPEGPAREQDESRVEVPGAIRSRSRGSPQGAAFRPNSNTATMGFAWERSRPPVRAWSTGFSLVVDRGLTTKLKFEPLLFTSCATRRVDRERQESRAKDPKELPGVKPVLHALVGAL